MSNHPNRGRAGGPCRNPTPDEIRAAREAAGLTQTEAARLICATLRAWQGWEAGVGTPGHRRMPAGLWELFGIKTGAAE